jgi:hypothetical protein
MKCLTRRISAAGVVLAVSLFSASLLSGCATPGTPDTNSAPTATEATLQVVQEGRAVLDCGFLCSASFIFRQHEFLQLYHEQRWRELAVVIVKVRWRQDISYFYLGAAAEGLQYYQAADRYYRMAGALATGSEPSDKCSSVKNLCGELVFPRDIVVRLREMARARQAAATAELADARMAPSISRNDNSLSSDVYAHATLIPDAPQTLLDQYVSARLNGLYGSGVPARETAFADQALELLNPAVAAQTRGNEIARPREIQALRAKLARQPPQSRLVVGMFVQLTDYDQRTQSFTVRYPESYNANLLNLGGNIFRGQSQRGAGVRNYTAGGNTCIWEPPQGYPRADLGDGFFVLLTACVQHPAPGTAPTGLSAADNEIPPLFFLVPQRGSLWTRFPLGARAAEQLISRLGPGRFVWSELVIDVVGIQPGSTGPFTPREVYTKRLPGLIVSVRPRGLFLWDTSGPEPVLFESLGEGRNLGDTAGGRLTASMIVEAPPSAPVASTPVNPPPATPPALVTPANTPVQVRTSASKQTDDEEWIVPPPAKK